jgi:Ca2+/Na+ antiporter
LQTPRTAHPERQDWPEFYNTIISDSTKFTSSNRSSVCILLSAQLVLLTNLYISMNKSIKWNIILFLITSLLLMLLLYFCLKMNYEKKKEDISKQNLETIIQLQQSYLSSYTHKYQELRKFNHDYNKQILMIKDYYLNQQDQLLPYLDILSHHLYKTNNDSQNHIINMLYQYFKEEYPQVHSHLDDQVLGTITMNDSKLSSLIYNLFKNSFEASSKITDKNVSISLKNKNNNLYIQIKNSIDQPVTLKEGYTNKENKNDHGIGLTIINEIVDEYHGINQYQQTDQCLVNDIILFDVIH